MAHPGGGAMGDGPAPTHGPEVRPHPVIKSDMMRPSQYQREMCMTTAERHRALSDKRELDRLYAGRRPYKAFTVIPHRIVFQKFDRCDTQEQQVIFRNDDCIPHLLRLMPSMSPYISVTLVSAQGGKLAPGMFVAYRVKFQPEEQCDYYYELQCTSDQVTFTVPVVAIGPRAILDFPDRIIFQNHPVQAETSKLLSIKNVGQKVAKFSLDVPKPFGVEPRCGTLPVDDVAQITVRFLPSRIGQHCEHALLTYDNGEKVFIEVHGCGVEVDVGLSNYTLRMETTFIGLASRKTLRLYNKSATPATFVWRTLESAAPTQLSQSSGAAGGLPAVAADPSLVASVSAGARLQLPPTAARPDTEPAVESTFQHPVFSIEPLQGEVWPGAAVEITAIFQPDSEGECDCVAYCQVTGRASRLPLHLSGRGRGADVQLSLDSLDIGAVFKNSVFNYEVVAVNRGDITASLRPLPGDSAWAKHISFQPAELMLHPKDHRTLVLTLNAQILGELNEQFHVEVSGASRPLTLSLSGRVVPPTLEFDSALLDFGVVAFGFRKVLRCRLKNTSLVPVEFSLSVPDDGQEPAIRQEKLGLHLYKVVKQGLNSHPKEFTLKPSKGVLHPQSSIRIKVELVPNTARQIATQLLVDIDGVKEALYSIPVSAQCVAADVQLRAPDVILGRHFKGRPAGGQVTLVNSSAVASRYFVLPQETMDFPGVTYRCEEPTGVIEPRSSATVPFTVQLQALGSLVVPIRLVAFGRPQPLQVLVRVVSQGPVIDIQPPSLDWGLIPVLTPQHKLITISNQAPVPAFMTATMQRSSNYWSIEPVEAVIDAEQTLSVKLTAVLDDPLRFFDVLVISVQDSGTWEIPVSAQGRGSSILFEPPLRSVVDLGPVFCKSPVTRVFTATNKGRRYHQLVWSNEGVVDHSMTSMTVVGPAHVSSVKLGRRTPGLVPVFRVTPRRVDMYPAETQSFTLEAYCESVGKKREEVSCTAMVGNSSGKTVLRRLVVVAEFITPDIEFSRREIRFERKHIPGVELSETMSQNLTLTNNSPLALTTHIRTQYPFLLRNLVGGLSAELDYELGVDSCVTLEVLFDPDYETGLTSRYIRDKLIVTYEEHPHCDEVVLIGIVSFPNLTVSDKEVDFGCILNDMESFRKLKITNCSKVPVYFHWYFVDSDTELDWLPETEGGDVGAAEPEPPPPPPPPPPADNILQETKVSKLITVPVDKIPVECYVSSLEERQRSLRQRRVSRYLTLPPPVDRRTAAQKLEAMWKKQAAVSEILDIYPMRGKLQPGDNTSVVFKFYGHGSVQFSARAVCVVRGGPQYAVRVCGRASSIRYRLEQPHVDCGAHIYCQFLETSTSLHNSGQVEFRWRLQYEPEEGRLQVTPTEGVLQAGVSQRITIRFLPMIPEYFERQIEVAVAHFPPELITVTGHGAYPAVMLDLPLQYDDISEYIFLEAVQNISTAVEAERRSLQSAQSSSLSERLVKTETATLGGSAEQTANPAPPPAVDAARKQSELPERPAAAEMTQHFPVGAEEQPENEPAAPTTEPLPAPAPEPAPAPAPVSDANQTEAPAPAPDPVSALASVPAQAAAPAATSDSAPAPDPGPVPGPGPGLAPSRTAPREAASKARSSHATAAGPEPVSSGDVQLHVEAATDSGECEDEGEMEEEEEEAGSEEQEDQEPETPPLSPSWSVISHADSAMVDAALIDLEVERLVTVDFIRSHPTTASFLRGDSARRNAVSLDLLKYYLDFGLVLLGSDLHRAITITNISQLPVVVSLITSVLPDDVDDDVKVNLESESGSLLPGESTYIHIRLRPSTLELAVETIQRMIYLEVRNGLFIPILLKATVTMPIAEMNKGDLNFGTVYIGMCKICQIKVHNNGILPAVWSLVARPPDRPAALPFSSGDRPRRVTTAANQPPPFTFRPAAGTLSPDGWSLVDVVFAPTKSKTYLMEAVLTVQGSSQIWIKRIIGEGLDSQLCFSTLELPFEPIVPYTDGGQMEVTIFNPHPMPLEIYSLEFDRQYLEEEHILRTLPGYSEFETLILPPRRPGEPLAPEVRAYYAELVHRASQPSRPPDDQTTTAATTTARESHLSLEGTQTAAGTLRSRSRMLTTPESRQAPPTPLTVAVPPTLPVAAGMAESSEAPTWPGWTGVLDQPAMWTLPALEQFISDYLELCEPDGTPPLPDPVAQAVQSYISSGLPPDIQLRLSRKSPAFVILSAPFTEPYLLAILVAERYGLTIVTVDQLVWESVLAPTGAAAHRARDFLCETVKSGARAPAVAKQPAKRGQAGSKASNGKRRSDSNSSLSQLPELREAVKPRAMPPALLGELIAERLMQPDVSSGVVFWDVHSCQFSASVTHTVMALLLGLGKRKHAYFITLDNTAALRREATRRQDPGHECPDLLAKPAPPTEAELLLCDEADYDRLEERDQRRLNALLRRARRQRYRERRDELRRLQEQLRQEHEKKSRKGKGAPLHKQVSHHTKLSSSEQSEGRKSSIRKPSALSKASLRRSDISIEPHDKKRRGPPKRKGEEDAVMDEHQIEEEKMINAQFKAYSDTLSSLVCLLDIVDRDRLVPEGLPTDDVLKFGSTAHKRNTRGRGQRAGKASTLSKRPTTVEDLHVPTDLGVTHVLLNGSLDCHTCYSILVENGVLPEPSVVRDDMGLGPDGPPLAPCREFAVVKRPSPRPLPDIGQPVFTFKLDEAEKAALAEAAAEKQEEKAQRSSPEKSPPAKRRGQRRQNRRRRSDASLAGDQKTAGSCSNECDTDLATAIKQALRRDDPVVSSHRWVVPAEGELTLTVRFDVNRPGRYQGRLQLETTGTRRRYTVQCSGSCVLPLINRKIRTLYAKVPMRSEDGDEHGVAFVRGSRTLAFGPLPVVKQSQRPGRHNSAVGPPSVPHGHQAEITMENISPLPVDISFYLFNDTYKVPPFLIWPPTLSLAPGEKDYLQVMALPPSPQPFEDMLIGCVKDNPDPWITKLTCVGAKPEVHLDKKALTFDRVLLLRQETRKLSLTNKSLIPLRYRMTDIDQLGDAFKFKPRVGQLLPLGVAEIEVEFSPVRPCLYHNKKIKLEITEHVEERPALEAPSGGDTCLTANSASDNSAASTSPRSPRAVLGVLQSETIVVSAEGFDVAVDLMFPKGLATGVDFGTIKVKEESKQTFTIKNKGKYEIMFKAFLEDPDSPPKGGQPITHGFHINPDRGILHPHERPLVIQMLFSTETEVWIKKKQMLRVQVLDFHRKEEGEVIALIPVCVSVRALFCQYSVTPNEELHLGHFPVAVRKTGYFVIRNDGKFDFSYHIIRKNVGSAGALDSPKERRKARASGARGGSSSSKSTSQEASGAVSAASVGPAGRPAAGQASKANQEARAMKLMAGIFSLQPAMGTISVGSQAVVNVEALSNESISDTQELVIRISDAGDGVGIPFRLLGHVTSASIRDPDGGIVSIFEEHAVVDSLLNYRPDSRPLATPPSGVYGRQENRFLVSPTIVGDSAVVAFKVQNTCMVPVDIVIGLKPAGQATTNRPSKSTAEAVKVFDVSPARATIPVHGYQPVLVTFTPTALQTFVNVLDVQIEETTGVDRTKGITFEVVGEGTLPRVDVLEPAEVNRQQEPLLGFLSTRLGSSAAGTVRLRNSGLIECMVDLLLPEGGDVFTVLPDEETLGLTIKGQGHGMISDSGYVLGTVRLRPGAVAVLTVTFTPRAVGPCAGLLHASVNYNAFQRLAVRLSGHGYNSGVILHGLNMEGYVPPPPPPPPSKSQKEEPPPVNVISMDMPQLQYWFEFLACYIGATYRRQFRMENCSDNTRYRFEWRNSQYLTFSPAVGHLAPREIKTVTAAFVANEPINFEKLSHLPADIPPPPKRGKAKVEPPKPEHVVACVVTAIEYPEQRSDQLSEQLQPEGQLQLADGGSWDERTRTMQLVPVEQGEESPEGEEEEQATRPQLLPQPEPAYDELAPAPALRLDVPAVLQTDLPRPKLSRAQVNFDDTFMFQSRPEQVTLENVGQAELRYAWTLEYVPPPARPVSAQTQVYSSELDSETSVVNSGRSAGSGASFLQLMSQRIDELADYVPFSVEPRSGAVPPGQTAVFDVRFSPLDVQEYSGSLRCSIPYLPEDVPPPSVGLHGQGVLPVCHFDLEQTSCRERADLAAPTDCDLRVVAISAVGVNRKVSRAFSIINPTESSWHYAFINCDQDEGPRDAWFRCVNPTGVVHSGQRSRVRFEFFPRAEGEFRSRWQFVVEEHQLTVELLLLGTARDPVVYATEPLVRLSPVLTGMTSHGAVSLVNDEDWPLRFQLDLDSCYSASQALRLTVQPIEGLIPAKGTVQLGLQYSAQADGAVDFALRFHVETRHEAVPVTVKAEGYTLLAEACLLEQRARPRPLSADTVNQLDLGLIPCRDIVYRTVELTNTGGFPFTLEMEHATEVPPPRLTVTFSPDREVVEPRKRITCKFGISCASKIKFNNIKILVKVVNGPCFALLVRGSAEPPNVAYSATAVEFGPCFLHQDGMPAIVSELKLENRDKQAVSVGVELEDVPYFRVDFTQTVIAPSQKTTIPIVFVPLETKRYVQNLTVVVNGQAHRTLRVTGEGIRFQVEVGHPQFRQLVLGSFRVGQRLQRSVTVVNRADAPVRCKFQLSCNSPSLQNLAAPVLRLRPAEAELRARSSLVLELQCFSKVRLAWFQEEVRLSALGLTHTLLTVEGTCQGLDLRLDVPSLPFGPVAAYSRVTRNVCLINDGDIGARFRWSAESLQPEFSIRPTHGYAAPQSRVVCEVTLHPKELSNVIKKEGVACEVENYGSLPLTLTGSCVPVTAAKEPLQFLASVRAEDVRTIQIPNKTNASWEVVPIVSGEFWRGQEVLLAPAQSVGTYAVTYRPMAMTAPGQKHTGSVFMALPDGQALLYSLVGTAEPPQPAGRIAADIASKTAHTETVDVENWLTEPQRFVAKAEVVRSEKDKTDVTSVRLSGLDYLDVPALATVPYTLSVYCYKEGTFHIKLTFRNEKSDEYLFYDLSYRVTKTHERRRVVLHTVARRAVPHSVLLERPLDSPMTCQVNCNMNELILGHHGTIHFPAGQEARVAFECLPLREGTFEAPLEVHSQEMGAYGFDLHVTARPPPLAGTVTLTCPLGQSVTKQIKFTNFSKTRAEYATQLVPIGQLAEPHELSSPPEPGGRRGRAAARDKDEEKPRTFAELLAQIQSKGDSKELLVDRSVTAPPGWPQGIEASFDLTYEPADVCSLERGLVLSSPHGGEFRFAVYGTCTLPEPQGPFNIKQGGNVVIPFKNVFPASAQFTYYVDSPYFTISKTPETIRAKKDIRVTVSFDQNKGPPVELSAARPITGCLTVAGPALPHGPAPAWRYYLRGLPSDK